jgi:quercetin dioxygenase-like cupin family protein
MKPVLMLAAGSAALIVAASVGVFAQSGETAQKDTLLKTDKAWNGTPYPPYQKGQPELTMLRLTIAPHAALPWHSHLAPNAGYLVSGQLKIEDRESGKSIQLKAGDAFAETVNDIHRGINDGDTPTVVIITYAGIKGEPTSKPAPGEKPEY